MPQLEDLSLMLRASLEEWVSQRQLPIQEVTMHQACHGQLISADWCSLAVTQRERLIFPLAEKQQ